MEYKFDLKLTTSRGSPVLVDTGARYGYWERLDGSEGGGLWFDDQEGGILALADYDGTYELRQDIVDALRAGGFIVGEEFDAE